MKTTDTSEKGLESLIVQHMTGTDGLAVAPNMVAERPLAYGGTGYIAGSPQEYDRAYALDTSQLFAFLEATQPEALAKLALGSSSDTSAINRTKFLTRLSSEIGRRGVIDVLRKGIEIAKRIRDDIAPKVAADTAFKNAKENTPHTARLAHDQALGRVMQLLLKDDTQVYKQFVENESFRRFVGDMVYALTSM